mmetsp:Transcript_11564/g.33260  ORF Transcript_11564/g.33260 Transcript_11564/m.33260 type:complete len:95 (-) Transcript_11564:4351-4635(-)
MSKKRSASALSLTLSYSVASSRKKRGSRLLHDGQRDDDSSRAEKKNENSTVVDGERTTVSPVKEQGDVDKDDEYQLIESTMIDLLIRRGIEKTC